MGAFNDESDLFSRSKKSSCERKTRLLFQLTFPTALPTFYWFSFPMAKGGRGRRRIASQQYRSTPYPLMSCNQDILEDLCPRRCSKGLDKKDWEGVTCSVCMEYPHNAVLLLCSSHDNGCRPYMCGTSFRYSNCLDQYKKAYTKVMPSSGTVENPIVVSDSGWPVEKCEVSELACPFCRGQVKGWTVVEPAREYLNEKRRSCMQDNCSFVGTYKELRKHMKANHPCAQPRELDPVLEQKWRSLERERERDDVMSTIRSAMPGALVFGDYVIEGNHYDFVDEENRGFDADGGRHGGFGVGLDSNLVNIFFLLHHAFGPSDNDLSRRLRHSARTYRHPSDDGTAGVRLSSAVGNLDSSDQDDDNDSNNDNGDDGSVRH